MGCCHQIQEMLVELRNHQGVGNGNSEPTFPIELEQQIQWYSLLGHLPLVYQDTSACLIMFNIALEKLRRE
jgi:hypothetical protein